MNIFVFCTMDPLNVLPHSNRITTFYRIGGIHPIHIGVYGQSFDNIEIDLNGVDL